MEGLHTLAIFREIAPIVVAIEEVGPGVFSYDTRNFDATSTHKIRAASDLRHNEVRQNAATQPQPC